MKSQPKKKAPAKKKPSRKLETEGYVLQVQKWIIAGKSSIWIIQEGIRLGWCRSERNMERYITKARNRWALEQSNTIEVKRIQKIAQLEAQKQSLKAKWIGTPAGIDALLKIERMILQLEGFKGASGFMPPQQPGDHTPPPQQHAVDYDSLPADVLKLIHNARTKRII